MMTERKVEHGRRRLATAGWKFNIYKADEVFSNDNRVFAGIPPVLPRYHRRCYYRDSKTLIAARKRLVSCDPEHGVVLRAVG